MKSSWFTLAVVFASTAVLHSAEITPPQREFFESNIRPILAENCFKCHSAAEGKTKGGLALDTRDGVLKGGEDGKVIVPGDPQKSMLMERLLAKDPEEKMPPPKESTLTPQQIAHLATWIKMGAPDPRTGPATGAIAVYNTAKAKSHWAYQPVKLVAPPQVKKAAWVKTPVDNYILSRLEQQGMTPAAPADRSALIRRAYFDLTGLPPMPWEVQAFIVDKTPGAWENVVDRLLASSRYGERWGRYWLDVARYSDTKGDIKKGDDPRYIDAWTYRDYVIDAFNQDRPYDLFIKEQLAADKLVTGPDKRPLAALGFLTVGDRFSGNRNDIINDRIDVVTKGFLGLTVSCARCHDHMFDPIPQKDYYSLHGIFASTAEPKENPIVAARGTPQQYQEYVKARDAAMTALTSFVASEAERQRAIFRKDAGTLLLASQLQGKDRADLLRGASLNPKQIDELVRNFRGKGGGRGNPVLGPFYAFVRLDKENFAAQAGEVVERIAGGGDETQDIKSSNDKPGEKERKNKAGRGRRFEVNALVAAAFKGKSPQSLEEVAAIYDELFRGVQAQIDAEKTVKPAQLASAVAGQPPTANAAAFAELKMAPFREEISATGTPSRQELIQRVGRKGQGRFQQLIAELDKVELTHPGTPRRAMAVEDSAKAQNSPVFIRGEANNRGEIAPRRFLEILAGPNRADFTDGSGRKELAEAIASPKNPLTARVMINRIWQHHFGDGFVRSPDDLGTQSMAPSHPELLDYLSIRFVQGGWKIKPIHKLIMMSAVYQQCSETNPKFAAIDPANRLLWRFNIRRLDFEAVRDSLLYVSGKLDATTVGGQPVNIFSEPYSTRRSVYGYIDRANLPEMMNHFDFANPGMATGRRHETTVPQQALYMMNSPLMIEASRRLLQRPEMAPATRDDQKIHALYWMIYQRPPKPDEIKLGLAFLALAQADPNVESPPSAESAVTEEKFGKKFKNQEQAKLARKQVQQQKRKYGGNFVLENPGERVERTPLTPWEKFTHALLMANETVYYN